MVRLSICVVSLTAFVAACSSGKSIEADFRYLTEIEQEGGYQPEIPTYLFELIAVEDGDSPEVVVLPDGKVVEPETVEQPDADIMTIPEEQQEDEGCQPVCTFEDGSEKECGPDGCGSICGYCGYGTQCVEGLCKEFCVPKCAGKSCGPDGCYGECPPGCEKDFKCGEDGQCYPDCDHVGNCQGKQCGPDGCGGSCGACGLGDLCDEGTGLCYPHPCKDVPEGKGKCDDGDVLLQCINGEVVKTVCSDLGEDYYCNWDGQQQKFYCAQGCVPTCTFPDGVPKECGYDGCYGVCGTCAEGWACPAGACLPVAGAECSWIPTQGVCLENQLWFCNGGKLYLDDCPANNMNCKFDTSDGKNKCK